MTQRVRSHLLTNAGLLLAAAVLFLACASVTSAQEKKGAAPATTPANPAAPHQAQQKAPSWSVRCTNPGQGLTCKATQTMVLGKTRQLLLSISVSKPTEGKNAAMLLQLPHGLFNPAGVTLGIDGAKPETLVIQTCDARGCYAGAPITPEKLSAMRAGAKLNVTFQILKKQKIVVPVPLKGFAEAYKKL